MRTRMAAWLAIAVSLAGCPDRKVPTEPGASGGAGALHFTDVTARSGVSMVMTCGRSPSSQIIEVKGGGLGLIDSDNDGDLDLFVPNGAYLDAPDKGPGSRLFANDGSAHFADVTASSGIDFHGWGMGVAVGDTDGNGADDLYVAAYGPDVLLASDGAGHFRDVTASAVLGDPRFGTAAAFGDLDNDGDVDVVVSNVGQKAFVLRNDGGNRQHWLSIRLAGKKSNRDGIGSRVKVSTGSGRTQYFTVTTAVGYLSASDKRVSVGLGTDAVATRIEIRWPSGIVQTFENVKAGTALVATEPVESR